MTWEQAKGWTAHVAITTACELSRAYVLINERSFQNIDKAPLELAKFVTMKRGGRAEKYLDNFLSGGGDIYFELKDLIAEDPLVRARIELELLRKIPPISENICSPHKVNPKTKIGTERHEWSVDPSITIFQRNYDNEDWWYALGSFDINWQIIQFASGYYYVKIWGSNEYKWHPEEKRITQCLHQAGNRLNTQSKRNFMIHAKPTIVALSEIKRKMIERTALSSFNPRSERPQISLKGLSSR